MDNSTGQSNEEPATPVNPRAATASWPISAGWLGIAVLLVVQYGLFRQYAQREVVWSYPTLADQTVYLFHSYQTYEHVLTQGLWPGIKHGLQLALPNGALIHVQASLLYLVLGPSRLSALTLNFAYFALFQIVLTATLRWYSHRWSVAFLGLGLLLATATPFLGAGGIMDFRLDFIAFCLFGILICGVVRSSMFRFWSWSLAVGLVAASLVAFRFLTMPYLVGVFGLFFVLLCFQLWRHRQNPENRLAILRQLGGLVLAGVVLLAITLPLVFYKWPAIRHYYIGHLHNGENAIRAREFGYEGTVTRLLYYPRSLLNDHAGMTFLKFSGICLLTALLLGKVRFWFNRRPICQVTSQGATPLVFTVLCVVVPCAVLTFYASPSPVVVGIAVGALVWSVLLATLWLLRLPRAGGDKVSGWGIGALAAAGMLIGVNHEVEQLSKRTYMSMHRAEFEELVRMYDLIGHHCQSMGWTQPGVSVNVLSEYFNVLNLMDLFYERQGLLLLPTQCLPPGTLMGVSEAEAVAAIQHSDIVILCQNGSLAPSIYPVNQALQELRPKLLAECERTLIPFHSFRLFDEDVAVYVRPAPTVKGVTQDDWITSEGLMLSAPSALLRKRPRIEVRGSANWEALGKVPTVHADLATPGQPPRNIQAVLAANGPRYQITVNLKPQDIPDVLQVDIHLTFDRYFKPCELGANPDQRRLVVRAPDAASLLPDP